MNGLINNNIAQKYTVVHWQINHPNKLGRRGEWLRKIDITAIYYKMCLLSRPPFKNGKGSKNRERKEKLKK